MLTFDNYAKLLLVGCFCVFIVSCYLLKEEEFEEAHLKKGTTGR